MKRRVVITGLGLITPIGNSVEESWSALMEGKSGVDYIRSFNAEKFPVRIAAEVKGFDPLNYFEKEEAQEMGAFSHYAVAAAGEALNDSGLRITPANSERIGTCISSGIGDFQSIERDHLKFVAAGPGGASLTFMTKFFINLAASHVAIRFGAKGPISAPATACSAGTNAIGDSFKIIQRGDADAMICGGSEATITPMSVAGFAALRALSTRNDEPQRASRPFERDRDGFVMGEGAGIMILEELDLARRRNAPIYAEIVGYGMSGDACHITMPDTSASGAVRVMRITLQDAGVAPTCVDYINAHGTGTPYNDKYETIAIKKVFGDHAYRLSVSSTKSMTGHLLGAAGAVEAVFAVLTVAHRRLPPTINYQSPDPECDLDYVPNRAKETEGRYALSNSFGFGGTNAALLFKRYEEQGTNAV